MSTKDHIDEFGIFGAALEALFAASGFQPSCHSPQRSSSVGGL